MFIYSSSALNKHSSETYQEQINCEKQFPMTVYIHFKDF